jgi:flagellar biosynthetic protein FliO
MVQNRKTIIILGLLLVAGGFCAAAMSRQTNSATSAAGGVDKSIKQTENILKTQAPSTLRYEGQAKDVNFPFAGSEQFKTGELFYKMVFAVLVVVALAIGVLYFLKRLLPKIAHLPAKQIRIVETVSLGQHRNIYLIEVSGRRLLIGGTNETIMRLADLSEPAELSEE